MWSGPRTISTALMRSWGSRPDTVVCDEPLYAHYLQATGRDHPGRDEILAQHEADWRAVVRWLTGPTPDGKAIFYQKHMAHHLLSGMMGDWLADLQHAFLIRDPREMLLSLVKVLPEPRLEDTGLPQQWALFQYVREETGETPPVLVAREVLEQPGPMLRALCDALGVPFTEAMLSWEPGPRPTDGAWARHWYATVEASTGFQPYRPKPDSLPDHLRPLHDEAMPYFEKLHAHRFVPDG
ncbi:MAG: HAD family hydrolase [Bacteroidetes bacterium]|nr:HAD family hydrolase [Bacteroidota bacterium]